MIDALDGINWNKIFYRSRSDAGGGRNKFSRLYEPLPMVLDYPSNVFRVMEWLNRYGRSMEHTQQETALLLPVGDNWFTSNLETEMGVFYHCCEPQKFFHYFDSYSMNYRLFMEQPRKAFRSTPYLTIARDMLWSMFNCIGKNYHYSEDSKAAAKYTIKWAKVSGLEDRVDWRGNFYVPTSGLVPIETESKHRCSRCPSEIPKRARAVFVLKTII